MIFLDDKLEDFLLEYPKLTVVSIYCTYCYSKITADKPVRLDMNRVGLVSDDHCAFCGQTIERIVLFCDKKKRSKFNNII